MSAPLRARLRLLALTTGLLGGSLACVEGCAHSRRGQLGDLHSDEALDAAGVEERLWPRGREQRWREPTAHEIVALEGLIALLMQRAEADRLTRGQRVQALALAELAGLKIAAVEIGGARYWLVHEDGPVLVGRGAYLIRRGELASAGELLVEAPHSFFDRDSGRIALALFLEAAPEHGLRALFVNTVHRYRRPDGGKQELGGVDDRADAAHAAQHPLARATVVSLRERPLSVVQIHGFARRSGDPAAILSSGSATPTGPTRVCAEGLGRVFPEQSVGTYGVDTDRLGATTNSQGHAARELGRCFLHVELSAELRAALVDDGQARARFAEAVFTPMAEQGADGCR